MFFFFSFFVLSFISLSLFSFVLLAYLEIDLFIAILHCSSFQFKHFPFGNPCRFPRGMPIVIVPLYQTRFLWAPFVEMREVFGSVVLLNVLRCQLTY